VIHLNRGATAQPNKRMDADGARPSGCGRAGTTGRRSVTFPDRAAAPQVMRGRSAAHEKARAKDVP
jgi:hypothetical protein